MISREEIFCGNIRKFPTIFSALLFEKNRIFAVRLLYSKYFVLILILKGMRLCGVSLFVSIQGAWNTQQKRCVSYDTPFN